MQKLSNFYNTSHVGYKEFGALSDDSVLEITIFIDELPVEVKNMFVSDSYIDSSLNRHTGYMIKKNINKLSEYLDEDVYIDIPHGEFVIEKPEEGYMFDGWGGKPVKITPEELPEWYIEVTSYKKKGFVNCKDVKSAKYRVNPIVNESIKDDMLTLTYYDDVDLEKEDTWSEKVDNYFGIDAYYIAQGLKEYAGIPEVVEQIDKRVKECERWRKEFWG